MKSNFTFGYLSLLLLLMSISCGQDYINDSRIFVEGKITSQNQSVNNFPIQLENGYFLISKGNTGNDGTFRLGGPDATSETELFLNKKITSFSVDAKGCRLGYDSLSIVLPKDRHSFKFSNITIEQ